MNRGAKLGPALLVAAAAIAWLWAAPARGVAQARADTTAAEHAATPTQTAALAGSWVLDSARSQLPGGRAERGREGDREGGRFGGRFRGGARPGGARPEGGRPGASGSEREEFQTLMTAMRTLLVRQPRLAIQQSGEAVTLATPESGAMQLSADGQPHDLVMPGDVHARTTTTWNGGRLVIDGAYAGGLDIEQSLAPDPTSPDRLVATVRIQGLPRGGTRTFTTVYDRAAPDSAAASAGGS